MDTFTPIPLGENYNYAFAPDGNSTFVVGLYGSPFYSPDGTLLVLASGGSDGTLRVVDARSGEVKASAQTGFSIRNVKFTSDRKALMVYGPHLVAEISVGAPRAALFDVSDLSVFWSVELKGIRHGIFPKKPGTMDIYQPGAAWNYEPGIAFAPNRDILYLVHGDEDKLTTVDFADRKVKTVDVRVQTSWLDQLLSLTAGVAYAKGMDGVIKEAVISPDGKFLYVVGSTETVTQQANSSNWDVTDSPIGLQVIAPEDGTLVDKISTDASSVRLSPDGRQVFLTGWKNGISWTEIYDISSNSIIKHLDNVYLMPTRRIDGKPILVADEYIGNNGDNVCSMASVDLFTWAITNTWKGYCVGWLLDP